jgi:3-phosphoshikimate 1-carboxyvinyltransferase
LSLYDDCAFAPARLVAFAMGAAGRESRLECLRLGAPFTYAALSADEATAPGQWTAAGMAASLYSPQANGSKDGRTGGAGRRWRVEEPIAMPSSKSFAQRAIVAAALAEGTSRLSGYSPCGDNESALAAVRALGAEVEFEEAGSTLVIKGIGAAPGCLPPGLALHTGESGFLTRLMIPLLAALGNGPVRVTGEKTLLNRPLAGAHDIMASFGVRLYPEEGTENQSDEQSVQPNRASRRKEDCYLPLTVQGPLLPGRAEVNGKGGSQLISGLLAALPLCAEKSTVYVVEPRSIPYLFITLDVLKQFGIRVGSEMEGDDEFIRTQDWALCSGITFRVKPGQRYQAADFRIEGDWSGAAPFLVAGAVFGDISVSGLDTASLQADLSVVDILTEAGASLSQLEGETPTTGILHVQKAPLRPFDADLNNCPDLFPAVAVLAAFCPGESRLLGVNRLTHKETDRAAAIRDMLAQMGVPVRIDDDEMTISGLSLTQRLLTGRLLKGGRYTSHGDHRMVMALKVAELGADAPIEIDDEACVAKSYPGFHRAWDAVTNTDQTAGNPA